MDNPRLTLTVNEAAKILGISRGLAYQMVKMGRIPSVHFGKRVLVPRSALEKLLAESNPLNLTQRANNPKRENPGLGIAVDPEM